MQKKSIYVAYTGGTIGMQRSEQGYIPVSGHLQRQLALMPEFHRPEMPDFTIHEYTPLMDSSDMTPEDWQHIAEDIKAHYDDYDGFVILTAPIRWHIPPLRCRSCSRISVNQSL